MTGVEELPCTSFPAALGVVRGATPLRHNAVNAATGGVWRVDGATASAVLKVARPPSESMTGSPSWQTSAQPAHWNFWRREVEAYASGLTSAYADAGVVAPELIDIVDRRDGTVELWAEWVDGVPGMSWPVPRLAQFAYQLGVAQARWLGRVPDLEWLSRGWLAQYVAHGPAKAVDPDPRIWSHPLAEAWPVADRVVLQRLWADRDRFVAAASARAATLCHLDVWPNNLVAADVVGGVSTLLDWAFVGAGAIGEDVANLIVDSVADGLMPAPLLPEINFSCTERYIEGLRDGGWSGSPDEVRWSIAVAGVAKYCWFSPGALGAAIRAAKQGGYAPSNYRVDTDPAAAVGRLSTLVSLLADWVRMSRL